MNHAIELERPLTERRRKVDRRGSVSPRLVEELAEAIEQDGIEVLFQPQFDCESGQIAGAEALLRWSHSERGLLSGDRVFALAREGALSKRLTRHLCDRAMATATAWPSNFRLSLNAMAEDLADPDYPGTLLECLRDSGFPASRLTLEITEQALVDSLDTAAKLLRPVADAGIAIALDDFGAGFCNFRYLKMLPLSALKLDRSMVEGIATDRQDLAVFRGILAMARALDLRVIAEGVETESQRAAVCREGCDIWQGFLGSRPISAPEFAEFAAV